MTSAAGSPETGRAAGPPGRPRQGAASRAATGTDPSDRDWARTRSSDATAPPLPASAAADQARRSSPAAAADSAPAGVRPVAARRSSLLVQGVAAAAVAAGLAAAVTAGPLALFALVVVLQVVLVRNLLALLDAPGAGSALLVAGGTGLAADLAVLVDGRIDRLSAVVGLGLVAALLAQLARRRRSRVTESLADTLVAALVAASAACLVALSALDGGQELLLLALAAAAAALLVGRLADRLLPRPRLATGSTRSWAGLLLGLLAAVAAALAVAQPLRLGLEPSVAALIALAGAATVVAADLAVDLGAAELRAGRRDRRRAAALAPAAALLPYALLGPVGLLAVRLVGS